ncbi:uncharacterized protein PV09_07326 [Verruconis gallopava]|uniref:Thioesterase domain-containing protein n=1 Tax=Verruconis gallopava TaxID=253628 RepID=A0A0D1XGF2_9PEZI|nr:uncharacterized protein PV09_07326 [Verruconis gallopava]KIW01286.1 hypothetical protein PV09_07326 [Verruconis gallopava]
MFLPSKSLTMSTTGRWSARRPLLVSVGLSAASPAYSTSLRLSSPWRFTAPARRLSSRSPAAVDKSIKSGSWREFPSCSCRPRRLNNLDPQKRHSSNVAPEIHAAPAGSSSLPPPRRHILVRLLATFGLFCVFAPIGFYLSAGPLVQTLREMESIPTDSETLELVNPLPEDPAFQVNETIMNHPLTKELLSNEKFSASRPHLKIPPSLRSQNFTAGTLLGPDLMPVPPLVFSTQDGTELVQIMYVGSALCGHPGLVHGGMLATLLDEGLARCCFPGLPNKVAVTASLKVDYRTPCQAGQYLVLKAETTKFEGRKAWVKGRIETLPVDGSPGVLVTEAEALFIEPRNAAILARQRKIIGGDEP